MRHWLAILALVLSFGCLAEDTPPQATTPAPDAKTDEIFKLPELKVTTAKAPPKIDGTLDDPAWKDAASSDAFKLQEGSAAQGKTKLYVMRDDNNLYVAIQCFDKEENLKALKTDDTEHDQDDIWADDSVEIFIDPTGKRENYYQLIINSKGVSWDAYHDSPGQPDKLWQPTTDIKCKVGKDSWIATMSLPYAIFDRTEKSEAEWAFNVAHTRTADS